MKNTKTFAVVVARAFDRNTGEPISEERKETIDLIKNDLFNGKAGEVRTILDIKNAYESFWNELSPNSKEVVFVSQVILK